MAGLLQRPVTKEEVVIGFRGAGVCPGDVLLVHVSLSALGFVLGGAHGLIEALLEVVGEEGTLVGVTQSSQLTEPRWWTRPPVPKGWWPIIREHTPAYHLKKTPSQGCGVVPEVMRSFPDARRSAHPHHSFCAIGPLHHELLFPHRLEDSFGETSPLARMVAHDVKVAFIGCSFGAATLLHLAEVRAGLCDWTYEQGAPVMENGRRIWRTFQMRGHEAHEFSRIGRDLELAGLVRLFPLGAGRVRLVHGAELLHFGVQWMKKNSSPRVSPG